jgi:hypothetical protein
MSSASRFNSSHEAIRCLLTRTSNILQFTTDHLSMIKLQSKDYSTHLTDLALRAKVSRSPLIITVLNGFSSWTLFECKTQGFWGIQTLPNHWAHVPPTSHRLILHNGGFGMHFAICSTDIDVSLHKYEQWRGENQRPFATYNSMSLTFYHRTKIISYEYMIKTNGDRCGGKRW